MPITAIPILLSHSHTHHRIPPPPTPPHTAGKELREAGINWKDVFQELPIKLHNSSLSQALIADLDPHAGATAADLERLNMAVSAFEAKSMEGLIECVDDLLSEQQKVSGYHRWGGAAMREGMHGGMRRGMFGGMHGECLNKGVSGLKALPAGPGRLVRQMHGPVRAAVTRAAAHAGSEPAPLTHPPAHPPTPPARAGRWRGSSSRWQRGCRSASRCDARPHCFLIGLQRCCSLHASRSAGRSPSAALYWVSHTSIPHLPTNTQENAARRAAGEEPLPEEDPQQFRPIVEPPALDTYLISNQIANYCDQISSASQQAMAKLYIMQGLQEGHV